MAKKSAFDRLSAELTHRRMALIAIVFGVVAWNIWQVDHTRFAFAASPDQEYLNIDPTRATAVLAAIDEYTPVLHESAVDLAEAMPETDRQGFVAATDLEERFTTAPTELEVEYLVQNGDTVMAIAEQYGLHVATLVDRNNIPIDEIENLKPGTVLYIPPRDTSDSTDWLVALNQKKEEERQRQLAEAAKSRQLASARATSRQTAASGYSSVAGRSFIVPIRYRYISRGLTGYHMGIDYVADSGTPVSAAQTGKVIETTGGWAGGFGNSVLVDHGGGLTTRYAHLSSIVVGVGQTVAQGQLVGYSGNTGYSTGPHLHLETRQNGRAINPF